MKKILLLIVFSLNWLWIIKVIRGIVLRKGYYIIRSSYMWAVQVLSRINCLLYIMTLILGAIREFKQPMQS